MKKFLKLLLPVIFLVHAGPGLAREFVPYGLNSRVLTRSGYFDSLGTPNLKVANNCPEEEDGDCWPVLINHNDEVVRAYPADENLTVVARARYEQRALMLATHTYECGEEGTCSESIIFDHNGTILKVTPKLWEPYENKYLDVQVARDGRLLILTKNELKRVNLDGKLLNRLVVPGRFLSGKIQNNIAGDQSVIGLDKSGQIWLGNGDSWWEAKLKIPERGDRRGILSVYPLSRERVVGAVYRYENAYKKGLYLIQSTGANRPEIAAPVYLSSQRNIGWDPQIFATGKEYYISARDSSRETRVQIKIPRSKVAQGKIPLPDPDEFPGGNLVSFFAGGGLTRRNWKANSKVEDKGRTLTDIDYDFEEALLKSGWLQGRVGNTRLVLNYLEQLSEEKVKDEAGKVAEESIDYLFGMVEFNNLFSKSSGLRLAIRRSKTSGLARISHNDRPDTSREFSVEFSQLGVYVTRERGRYTGIEYTDYQLPSAVGFNNEHEETEYSGFDENFGFQKFSLVGGYDPQDYVKRYETNYADWFSSGKFGLGIGYADLSSSTEEKAKNETTRDEIETPLFYSLDAKLSLGYMWQSRSRNLGGLGYQLLLGYKANGTHMQEFDDESDEKNKLTLVFERQDIWHGPFVNFNLVF